MTGPEVKSWATDNGMNLVQLGALALIFYVTQVSGDSAREAVTLHARSTTHPAIVTLVSTNSTAIQLGAQKANLLETQNQKDHKALLLQMTAMTVVVQKIALKLNVE